MRCQLDGGEDGGGSVGTSDDSERGSLLRGEAYENADDEHAEDAHLGSSTEDGKLEVAEHRTEVRKGSHTHEDDGREQTGLNEHIIDEIHQTEFVGNLMQRHVPDNLLRSVGQCHVALGIGLHHAHVAPGKIGDEHAEGNGNKEQGLVLLDDAQIEEAEGQQVHDDEGGVGDNVAEGRHRIQAIEYIVYNVHNNHYKLVFNLRFRAATKTGNDGP